MALSTAATTSVARPAAAAGSWPCACSAAASLSSHARNTCAAASRTACATSSTGSSRTWFATANATSRPTCAGWRSLLRTSAPRPLRQAAEHWHRIGLWNPPMLDRTGSPSTTRRNHHASTQRRLAPDRIPSTAPQWPGSRTHLRAAATRRLTPQPKALPPGAAPHPATAQLAAQQQAQGGEPQDDGGAGTLLLLAVRLPARPSPALQARSALLQRAPRGSRHPPLAGGSPHRPGAPGDDPNLLQLHENLRGLDRQTAVAQAHRKAISTIRGSTGDRWRATSTNPGGPRAWMWQR